MKTMSKFLKRSMLIVIVVVLSYCMLIMTGCGSDTTTTIEKNEWGELNDYAIRIVSVEDTTFIKALSSSPITTQNNFMCILVEIKNKADYSRSISYFEFEVSNGNNTFDSKATEAYWYAEEKDTLYPALYLNGTIDGNLSEKYYLVFETPSSSQSDSYTLVYEYGFDKLVFKI